MKSTPSFYQILQKVMNFPEETTEKKPPSKTNIPFIEGPVIPPHFCPQTFSIPPRNPYPKAVRRVRRKVSQLKNTTPPVDPGTPPSITVSQLTVSGQKALSIFRRLGGSLEDDGLSLEGLKKEFRRLAKKYHPDHNSQHTDRFIALKKAEAGLRLSLTEALKKY